MTELEMVRRKLQEGYVGDINKARQELVKLFGAQDATLIDMHVSQAVMLATPTRNLVERNAVYARLLYALLNNPDARDRDEARQRLQAHFVGLVEVR